MLRGDRSPSGVHLQPRCACSPPHGLPDSPQGSVRACTGASPCGRIGRRAHCASGRELCAPISAQGPGRGSCLGRTCRSPALPVLSQRQYAHLVGPSPAQGGAPSLPCVSGAVSVYFEELLSPPDTDLTSRLSLLESRVLLGSGSSFQGPTDRASGVLASPCRQCVQGAAHMSHAIFLDPHSRFLGRSCRELSPLCR